MMKVWIQYFKTLIASKKGQGMVEYGLIIGVVAVMLIGALVFMREQLTNIFNGIGDALSTGGGSTTP